MKPVPFVVAVSIAMALPAALVVGCAHAPKSARTPAASAPAADVPRGAETAPPALASAGGATTCTTDLDCARDRLCVEQRCVPITSDAAHCWKVNVKFDFNSALLPAAARTDMERLARCLLRDQSIHVTIEGDTDERGTDEYNLALGDQRAKAVERYVEAFGVSRAQLRTISYGKERPLCTEHSEACWQENRRATMQANISR